MKKQLMNYCYLVIRVSYEANKENKVNTHARVSLKQKL